MKCSPDCDQQILYLSIVFFFL